MNTNSRFTYFVTQSLVAILVANLLSVAPALSQESDSSRPNIVFIYADDLDADEIIGPRGQPNEDEAKVEARDARGVCHLSPSAGRGGETPRRRQVLSRPSPAQIRSPRGDTENLYSVLQHPLQVNQHAGGSRCTGLQMPRASEPIPILAEAAPEVEVP